MKKSSIHLVWLLLAACFVTPHASYVALPVSAADGRGREFALVSVELDELSPRMEHYAPELLSFYQFGDAPIPHALEDQDGDGRPDVAWVCIPVPARGTVLTALCPGPTTGDPFVLPGRLDAGEMEIDYPRSWR